MSFRTSQADPTSFISVGLWSVKARTGQTPKSHRGCHSHILQLPLASIGLSQPCMEMQALLPQRLHCIVVTAITINQDEALFPVF